MRVGTNVLASNLMSPLLMRKVPVLLATLMAMATPAYAVIPQNGQAQQVDAEVAEGYRALRALDGLINAIGFRMAVASRDLCVDTAPLTGMGLHDIAQYRGSRADAVRVLSGLGDRVQVMAVAPDSPAEHAGVRVGDDILAIDGWQTPEQRQAKGRDDGVETVTRRLEMAGRDGTILLTIRRRGTPAPFEVQLRPVTGCPGRFMVNTNTAVQAGSDGRIASINLGMIEFAAEKDQVAFLIGHEFAHNILKHRVRLLQSKGRGARQAEADADRWALYLMDRAGYDPGAAALFWRRYKARFGNPIFSVHPSIGNRIESAEETAATIRAVRARGEVPKP